jgi:hypothetical protein
MEYNKVCVFGSKLGNDSVNLSFVPVFKPHTHTLYILRHCTNIVYVFSLLAKCDNYNAVSVVQLHWCC